MKRMTDPLSAPPWPPTNFSLPELWERITAMFAVLMREARSAARLRQQDTTRNERYAIRCRLAPLETLVRSLLITEALIHLMMTPQGRDLIAAANSIKPPAPRSAASPRTKTTAQASHLPRERSRSFRVLAWQMLPDDDDNAPLAPPRTPTHARDYPTEKPTSARHLARRIEALASVMKDPAPAIVRLAKFIAGLPRHALDIPFPRVTESLGWWHGRPEHFNATTIETRAVIAFQRSEALREEPG